MSISQDNVRQENLTGAAPGPLPAGCVAVRRDGRGWSGVLIRGPSGVGKSAFALKLIALGARLVTDDQTVLALGSAEGDAAPGGAVWASPPAPLAGLIEARGVGILRLPHLDAAPLDWVVDLAAHPPSGADPGADRLPPLREALLLGLPVPCLTAQPTPEAAAAVFCLTRDGALLDPETPLRADERPEA